jgi:hypothetical protein
MAADETNDRRSLDTGPTFSLIRSLIADRRTREPRVGWLARAHAMQSILDSINAAVAGSLLLCEVLRPASG